MKVSELVKILKEYPQEMDVVYRCASENVMLEKDELKIVKLCAERPDGWVANERPDKPSKDYLVFPGN